MLAASPMVAGSDALESCELLSGQSEDSPCSGVSAPGHADATLLATGATTAVDVEGLTVGKDEKSAHISS